MQFPLAHPAVAAIIPGPRSVAEFEANLRLMRYPIPTALWADLRDAKLLPPEADEGLDFKPTHPKADEALAWMGFEARSAIIELLDEAIKDTSAEVRVVAYDLTRQWLGGDD